MKKMIDYFTEFKSYLINEKQMSSLTVRNYLNDLSTMFKSLPQSEIMGEQQLEQLLLYYIIIQKRKYSNTTINRKISAINAFVKFLFHNGDIKRDFSTELNQLRTSIDNNTESTHLTIGEYFRIDAVLNEDIESAKSKAEIYKALRNKVIIYTIFNTDIKMSELINLEWENINLKNSKISILKDKKMKTYYINDYLKWTLITYQNLCKLLVDNPNYQFEGYIFFKSVVNGVTISHISPNTVNRIINDTFKKALIFKKTSQENLRKIMADYYIDFEREYYPINIKTLSSLKKFYHNTIKEINYRAVKIV